MKIDNPVLLGQSSGFGIPTAGTSGQVLTKINSTDYNTRWSDAKSVTYNIVESGGATWVNLGRWTTTQTGKLLRITVMSHVGYNASAAQPQVTELYLSTSNNSSFQAGSSGNFFAAGNASVNTFLGTGDNQYTAPSSFRIIQASNTQYDVFGFFSAFAGGMITVDYHSADTWTPNGAITGSAPSGNFITITPLNSDWSVGEATTVTAITTNPTKPSPRLLDYTRYRLTSRRSAVVEFNLAYTSLTGVGNGSGQYLFRLPTGLQFNTAIHALSTADNNNTNVNNATLAMLAYGIPATGCMINDGVDASTTLRIVPYTSTTYRVVYGWGPGEMTIANSVYGRFDVARCYNWQFDISIA
jgi:hypothetical protein